MGKIKKKLKETGRIWKNHGINRGNGKKQEETGRNLEKKEQKGKKQEETG